MLAAVKGYYDGKQIIVNEDDRKNLNVGDEVIIPIGRTAEEIDVGWKLTIYRKNRKIKDINIKDGEVFHQIYRGENSSQQLYQKISDVLTMLATGGENR